MLENLDKVETPTKQMKASSQFVFLFLFFINFSVHAYVCVNMCETKERNKKIEIRYKKS